VFPRDTARLVLPRGTGLSGLAVRERRALWTLDIVEDPRVVLPPDVRERVRAVEYRAALSIPLIINDRVIGALAVGDRVGRTFDEDEIRLAQAFADQAARALENARLFRLESRRRAQVEALAEIERELAAELDLDRLMRLIVDRAGRLFGGGGVIYLMEDDVLVPRAATASGILDRPVRLGEGVTGACAELRRGLVANDYAATPYAVPEFVARGLTHAIAHPLLLRDRLLGVIGMGRLGQGVRPFGPDDLDALEQFATQAAIALDNARLHEETQRGRQEAEELARLARTLTETLDIASVGERIAASVLPLFRAHASGLRLLEPDGSLRLLATGGAWSRAFHHGDLMPQGTGVAGRAAVEGRPVWTADILADPSVPLTDELRRSLEASGDRAFLAAPLRVKGQVIGVLTIAERAVRSYSDREIALLETFADQAALALDNARLYREARDHGERVRALDEVNRTVSSSLEVEEVLHNLAAALARFFDAPCVAVWVQDPHTLRLRRSLTLGPLELDTELPRELGPDEGAVGWVTANRQPIAWTDMRADPRVVMTEPMLDRGLRYLLAYPIAIGDRVLGAFVMGRSSPPPESAESATILASLAAQAAVALDHARLYGETARRLEQTRALLEVAGLLNSTLDSTQLLKRVAITIAAVTRVDRCSIERWDGQTLVPVMSQFADGHEDPAMWAAFLGMPAYLPHEVPAEARAIETRAPVIVPDATRTDQIPRAWVEAFGHKSYMVVPILRQDELIGLMTLDYVHAVTPFEPWQVELAQAIAGQLALSLENARLYAEAQERLREATALLAVGQALSQPAAFPEQLRRVARAMGRIFGADMVGVYSLDERRECLSPIAGYRVPEALRDLFRTQPLVVARQPLLGELWRTGRSAWSGHAQRDERLDRDWTGLFPPFSVLVAPTRAHGQNVGALFLVWWETGRVFPPAERRLIEGVAAQVGLALENSELARQREVKVEELTRAYEELAAAQAHLVRTEKLRALGEMASGVAHDFNNLLAAILGRAQLLLRRVEDPTLRQWAQVIERSALDGARTVKRLQEFARVRRDAPFAPVDLNEVVRGALDITEARWREEALRRGVDIAVRAALVPVPSIDGDAAELREALTNLILNAVDAMPGGGVLTLSSAVVDGAVELAVADTGVGIPDDVRERIFDPFFTTKGPQGTGMGLSMTYGIVSRHRGSIGVESQAGRGTTFRLRFPPSGHATPPDDGADGDAAPPERLRCLVVDDEEAVGTVIGDVLQAVGHDSVVVTDGAAAIERFAAERFDAVFTDLSMPVVSGWQVAHAVKARAPEVPVFVVTGFGVELSPEERNAHGVEAIYAKPLKIADITEALALVARLRVESRTREGA
jgi:GAF domain-containing protein/CheY-like chemotaxis protein